MSENPFSTIFKEYFNARHSDYELIAKALIEHHNILFQFNSPDNITSYIVHMTLMPRKLTDLSFGGRVDVFTCLVGVLGRGFHYFDLRESCHGPDVQHRLNLCSSDASDIALLLTEVFKVFRGFSL